MAPCFLKRPGSVIASGVPSATLGSGMGSQPRQAFALYAAVV